MGLPLTAINRLITPTGTPDMVLAGGGITNVATSMTLNASPGVPANVPAAGTVRALIYNTGDTNPEFIDIDLGSRSTLTFTIARETEESAARPKCAHSAGAGIWFVGTAAMFSYAVGGLSVQELVLGADYTVPNGSFGDVTGMSITLPPGDYLVQGQIYHMNPSGNGSLTVDLTDGTGTTVYAHTTGSQSSTFFGTTLPINKKITLAATTTVKLRAQANTGSWKLMKGDQLALGAPHVLGTVLTFTSGGGGGGGALVLLEQHTASGSASLDFTAAISPTYDEYEIHVNNIVPTVDNVALCLQVSTDGGVTWDTGAHYQWSHLYEVAGGTGSGGNDTGGAANIVLAPNITTVANFSLNGRMTLFNPLGSNYKAVVGHFHTRFSSGDARRYGTILDGQYEQTTPVNALRFIIGGGSNIASGTIRIYGVAKTGGGPSSGMTLLQEISPSGGDVDFTSIPNTYKNLVIEFQARGDTAATSVDVAMQLNGDTAAHYDWNRNLEIYSGLTSPDEGYAATSFHVMTATAASTTAGYATFGEIKIPNYIGATFNQNFNSRYTLLNGSVARDNLFEGRNYGWWRSAAAINEIKIFPVTGHFAAGSVFRLYGLN